MIKDSMMGTATEERKTRRKGDSMPPYPTIFYCKHSYGSDGIMTDCSRLLDNPKCKGRKCLGFEMRQKPKNEDERTLQQLEWE